MYNAGTIVRMQPVYTFIINDANLRRNIDRVTVNKDVKMSMSINKYSNQDIIEKLSVPVLSYPRRLVNILHQFAFGTCNTTTCTSPM